jgi:hypothetical protein
MRCRIVVETVSDCSFVCGNTSCDTDANTEGNGFWNAMTASGTGWAATHHFMDGSVFDTDFEDPQYTGFGSDEIDATPGCRDRRQANRTFPARVADRCQSLPVAGDPGRRSCTYIGTGERNLRTQCVNRTRATTSTGVHARR